MDIAGIGSHGLPRFVRKAITSWRVVASISSMRAAWTRARPLIRPSASSGIKPRLAYTSHTASSTCNQASYLASWVQIRAISGRA